MVIARLFEAVRRIVTAMVKARLQASGMVSLEMVQLAQLRLEIQSRRRHFVADG